MAAYAKENDYLCGEELEEYINNLLLDEEDESAEIEENIPVDELANFCTCGNVATSRRADCNLVHFTCDEICAATDGSTTGTSNTTNRSSNAGNDSEIRICGCCLIAMEDDSFTEEEGEEEEVQTTQPNTASLTSTQKRTGRKRSATSNQRQVPDVVTPTQPSARTSTAANRPKAAASKKKQAPKVRQQNYKKEEALKEIPRFILQALESVAHQPAFSSKKIPNSAHVKGMTAELIETKTLQADDEFIPDIGKRLWDVVCAGGEKYGPTSEEKVTRALHDLKLNKTVRAHWATFVSTGTKDVYPPIVSSLLLLHIMRCLFQALMKARNTADLIGAPEVATPGIQLGEHDEQVLRYAAGYIPFALVKKFQKETSNRAKGCTAFLLSWKIPHDSLQEEAGTFLQYTTKWVEQIDRGGLFRFNDEVYMFLRSLEIQTLKCLNKSVLLTPNVNKMLMTQLNENPYVQRCWNSLVADKLPQEFSSYLLKVIKLRWIKLRVTAFVKVYLIIAKLKNKKVSRKGEKAMRKTVDKE